MLNKVPNQLFLTLDEEPVIVNITITPENPTPLSTIIFTAEILGENISEVYMMVKEADEQMCMPTRNFSMDIINEGIYECNVTLEYAGATYIGYTPVVNCKGLWYEFEWRNQTLIREGTILYVGGTGEGNYTKIQDAIDDANDGDTVFVYSGIYYEKISVNKSIFIIGEDKNKTIINAGVTFYYTVYVLADWVCISGFTITTKEDYGCGIEINANHTTIKDNILLNNENGISLRNSYNTLIIDNILISHNWSGGGISLYESYDNTITRNNISISYYITGIVLSSSDNNTVSYNILKDNEWGLHIAYSDYNTFYNNIIYHNYNKGIGLSSSTYNVFTNNSIIKNPCGIDILESYDNIIIKNNFIQNKINAYFINYDTFIRRNIWKQNYWNRPRLLPKPIFGITITDYSYITIPWINFDWHPAKEPYDI